ncbi:MAG: hypothetical protein ACRECU_02165 [Methylocella sp.]
MTKPMSENVPKALDAIADVVLAYRPKPKTKSAKKRKRHATKIAKTTLANAARDTGKPV